MPEKIDFLKFNFSFNNNNFNQMFISMLLKKIKKLALLILAIFVNLDPFWGFLTLRTDDPGHTLKTSAAVGKGPHSTTDTCGWRRGLE